MGWFIIGLIVALACIITFACAGLAEKREDKIALRVVAVAGVLIAFVLVAVSGLKSVPVKNIGVAQAFGAVEGGYYSPGIHETWTPWLHLTDIDETVQTTTYEGNNCLTVRIGGQQTACADITIQWKVLPSAAGSLFSDYANSGNLMTTVTDAVVVRELKQTVNEVLGDYNPITDVASVTGTTNATSQFTGFGPAILSDMRADIGNRIDVLTVLLPYIHYDASVEAKLEAIQQAYANFAIAQENVKVAAQQSLAYKSLGNPTVAQLVSECLSNLKDETGLPVGFQCFPGAGSGLALSSGS
jgi:regulator of protease activity HflC (stomatin/prohibitin superfamily)